MMITKEACPKCRQTNYIEKWVECFPYRGWHKKLDGYRCLDCKSHFNDLIAIKYEKKKGTIS